MKNILVNVAVLAVSSISLAAVAAPAHMTKKATAVVKHQIAHVKKGKLAVAHKATKKAKHSAKVASFQMKKKKA